MTTPALYECTVRHTRLTPKKHAFSYRTYQWFVDLDQMPDNRLLAAFHARDHAGNPGGSIRANLDAWLADQGIDLGGGPVRMLTNARVLGYVFNPLTVYWCHFADGRLAAVVAEVHNTYGGRHRYLLHTDEHDRADTAKAFYVSPFFAVDGTYRMRLPEPGDRLALAIVLETGGGRPFVATLRGRRRDATPGALLAAAIRHPLAPLAVTARIRWQGLRLWARGLPIVPRTPEDA